MCGIVCIIAKGKFGLATREVKSFNEMLFADQLRGIHGTGVMYDTKQRGVLVHKAPISASRVLSDETYQDLSETFVKESTFLVGHNRWATKGAHTYNNTHPFKEGSVTLVHNGTLWAHAHLANTEVDSHAICHSINKEGIDETVLKMYGAYALIWHDSKDSSLNLIRNKERPLCLVETKNSWIVCSEVKLGEWIATRNDMEVITSYELEVGILNSFDLLSREWSTRAIKERPVVESTYKVTPFVHQGGLYDDKFDEANDTNPKSNVINLSIKRAKKIAKKTRLKYGEVLAFLPFSVHAHGDNYYLRGYTEDEGREVEVRYFHKQRDALQKLISDDYLLGCKVNEVYDPKSKERYYSVDRVSMGIFTRDKKFISAEDVSELADNCDCCGGVFNKSLLELNQSSIMENTVPNSPIKYRVHCPDCASFMEKSLTRSH